MLKHSVESKFDEEKNILSFSLKKKKRTCEHFVSLVTFYEEIYIDNLLVSKHWLICFILHHKET